MPAVDAAISDTLTGRCQLRVVLSPLKPDHYLVGFRNYSGKFSHTYGAAGPVAPEQDEYALRFTKPKCSPAAWMDFPPGEEEKLVKLSINMKNP